MKRRLLVLYGSQTGTAQAVAERIGREAKRLHFETRVKAMDDYEPFSGLSGEDFAAFVCATTGQGDQPDNMAKFWRALLKRTLPKNLLSGLNYGVLGLGDSGYAQFNYAAKRLNRRLGHLGAKAVVPVGLADDQHDLGPDFVVDTWVEKFWEKSLELFPLPDGLQPLPADGLCESKYCVEFNETNSVDKHATAKDEGDGKYGPSKPYMARLISNGRVTSEDHFQDTRLVKIDSSGLGPFSPGDVCMVQPRNSEDDVAKFLALFANFDPAANFAVISNDPNYELPPASALANPSGTNLRECARCVFDFKAIPGRYFFELLAKFTTDDLEREKFVEFTTAAGQQELYDYCNRPRRNILEVLADFSANTVPNIPLAYLFDLMPVIKPRAFSIANPGPETIELLVAVVEYKSKLVEPRRGLCSNWLKNLRPGIDTVPVWVKKGSLRFPPENDPATPVVMVGPGTGVAPFRAFVRDDVCGRNTGRKTVLVFGCRNRKRDFYFEDEWAELCEKFDNFDLLTAFSRDQEDKVYVQHVIEANAYLIGDLIVNQNAVVYIAGNAKQMPDQVKDAIKKIFAVFGQVVDPAEYLTKMETEKRLQLETWS